MVLRSEWLEMTPAQKDMVEQQRLKVSAEVKAQNEAVRKQIDDELKSAKAKNAEADAKMAEADKKTAEAEAYVKRVHDWAAKFK